MSHATIDWDATDLLPKFRCTVCAEVAVPYGRTPDNRYFCSQRCCDAHTAASVFEPARWTRPARQARHHAFLRSAQCRDSTFRLRLATLAPHVISAMNARAGATAAAASQATAATAPFPSFQRIDSRSAS